MTLTDDDLLALSTVAARAARRAGALIASSRPQHVERKPGFESRAAQVVTEVDRAAEAIILEELAPESERYDFALLTEEREDDGSRHHKDHFWCIDPLDGTLPWIEGERGYAVSIALVAADGRPRLGVAYRPADDVLFRAADGQGAWRVDAPLRMAEAAPSSRLSVFADRSFYRHPEHARIRSALDEVAAELSLDGVEVHAGAGAVVNACRVLESPPACYFKLPKPAEGGGSLWDFAATACLAHEVGAVATDIFGAPLDLNRPGSSFMSHRGVLYASDARVARAIQQRISS